MMIDVQLFQRLGGSAVVVALIGYLESIALAKAFGRKGNYKDR